MHRRWIANASRDRIDPRGGSQPAAVAATVIPPMTPVRPANATGRTLPQFSKRRWPAEGPVRALLTYLDRLHREAGQPSLSEIGRDVALAPSTLSAFFTGARLISRGNLELVVSHLGGDVERAERLRRKAATDWNTQRVRERDKADRVRIIAVPDGG